MNIRRKLFFSFLLLSFMGLAVIFFITMKFLSLRYWMMTSEMAANSTRQVEGAFYDNLGEILRKSIFLSEMQEVIKGFDDLDALDLSLGLKSFFFAHMNLYVLDEHGDLLLSQDRASFSCLPSGLFKDLPLMTRKSDPLLRDVGIYEGPEGFYMAAVSPVIDQESFILRGYILLEMPLSREFLHQLKEKARAETTLFTESRLVFTSMEEQFDQASLQQKKHLLDHGLFYLYRGERYATDSFTFAVSQGESEGKIVVALNVESILAAKKVNEINIAITSVLVFLLILLVSFILGGRMSRPLTELLQAVKSVARGDLDVSIKPRTRDESGQLAVYFNEMTTALKSQRARILELKQFFENVFSHSPSALVILDESLSLVSLNPAAEKLLKCSQEELQGQNFFLQVKKLQFLRESCLKVLLHAEPLLLENQVSRNEKGQETVLRLVIYQVTLTGGLCVVMQMEDVSEKYELETKLLHTQKLGLLGELLGRFSHEFNNLMAVLLGQISLLKREAGSGKVNEKRVAAIEEVAQRTNNLGRNMLDFSKREKPRLAVIDLVEAVGAVLQLLEKTVLKNIKVDLQAPEGPYCVRVDREKMLLAFFNLLLNARDAIELNNKENGHIEIAFSYVRDEKGARQVMLCCRDNGCGIEDSLLEKIFEPYYSTKGEQGTGLGLAMVRDIVEEYGGRIVVESKVDLGASFEIYFPVSK